MAQTLALSPVDLQRRARLRRSKAAATSLLAVAAVVFVLVQPAVRSGAGWAGWVAAAAEAGMVGGLADWFAVTALFRHPLGLPIPHTALIPRRKDALGRNLAGFVGENFLDVDVVRARVLDIDLGAKVGGWLVDPANARRVTDEVAAILRGALEVLSDADVRAVAESAIGQRVRTADIAPVLGKLLGQVVQDGSHHPLVDVAAERTARWLRSHSAEVIAAVESQAPTWSPAFVDRALAKRVHAEMVRISEAVAVDPHHRIRVSLDHYLSGLAADLRDDPETGQRLRALALRLVDHPATRDALGTLVGATRRAVVELIGEPDGELRARTTQALGGFGRRLMEDQALRAKVDGWLGDAVEHVVTRYRHEITRTITDTVERWDGDEAARRIELAAGSDLQFIRINGTVVGALAGVALHAVSTLAF